MLRQEINLYRHFEAPPTSADLITWKRFLLINVVIIIVLSIIYISSLIKLAYLNQEYNTLQAQLVSYQSEFDKIKRTLPQIFFDKDINEAVKSIKAEIAAQQAIIAILSRHTPFSDDLIAFSRTIVPNVWLSKIDIDKNGDEITIKGDGIGVSNVHEFIANMEKDKILGNYSVNLNQVINKDVNNAHVQLNFEIKMVKKDHE